VVVNGPSTFTATFQGVSVSMITVSDFLFQPKNVFPPIGGEVRWNFAGPSLHTVTDNTGMGLYDSGSRAPGGSYSFAFPAAGNYPFRCTIHPVQMRGSVQIPVAVSPTGGGVSTPFSITWASGAPPVGYVYDVQVRRAGSSTWQYYRQGTATTSAVFTPDAGVGIYSFQARIRLVSNGRAAAFSTPVSIDVA
jgi:plastocyanin